MTTGERKALIFLAGVTVLGAAARIVTAPSHTVSVAERLALATQITAVDSARASHRAGAANGAVRKRRAGTQRVTASRSNGGSVGAVAPTRGAETALPSSGSVDADVADAAALETLPGIGPTLARRIVEERDARGPFGSLAGLERVRGVGPRLAARMAPRVTFSGVSRLTNAAVVRVP